MGMFGRRTEAITRRGDRGEFSIGCLLMVVVVVLVGWVGYKIGRPYFDHQSLNEKVGQEATLFQAKSDDELRQAIFSEAERLKIPVSPEDILIVRPTRLRIEISLQWDVDVAFPFGKHFRKTMKINKEAHTI